MFRRFVVVVLCALFLPAAAAQAWTWPVDGPVLRPFSFDRAHPYTAGQHRGVDLGAPTGTKVLAPSRGVVAFAGTVPTGGKTVSIETPFGYTATLVHLGSILVQRGATVAEGAVVGTVGPSGVVDLADPYVYFGLRVTGEDQGYVDPLAFLPPQPVVQTPTPQPEPAAEPVAPVATAPADASATVVPAATVLPVAEAPSASDAGATAGQADATPATAAVEQSTPAAAASVMPAQEVSRPATNGRRGMVSRATSSVHGRPLAAQRGEGGALSNRAERVTRDRLADLPRAHTTPSHDRSSRRMSSQPGSSHTGWLVAAAAALLLSIALACVRQVRRNRVRIMSRVEPESFLVAANTRETQDPGGAGLAVCVGQAAPGTRRGVRGSRGHLRAVPPLEGQRRPDGERDRRARDARDGHGGSRGRLAA